MEQERAEAYRNYVSDSLALYTRFLTNGEADIPRYADMLRPATSQENVKDKSEKIISKFDKLRRK